MQNAYAAAGGPARLADMGLRVPVALSQILFSCALALWRGPVGVWSAPSGAVASAIEALPVTLVDKRIGLCRLLMQFAMEQIFGYTTRGDVRVIGSRPDPQTGRRVQRFAEPMWTVGGK